MARVAFDKSLGVRRSPYCPVNFSVKAKINHLDDERIFHFRPKSQFDARDKIILTYTNADMVSTMRHVSIYRYTAAKAYSVVLIWQVLMHRWFTFNLTVSIARKRLEFPCPRVHLLTMARSRFSTQTNLSSFCQLVKILNSSAS